MIKPNHFKEKRKKGKTEDNKGSDQKKKKKKRDRSGTEEKVEEKLAEAKSEKTTIKCSSFSGLMGKVKVLKIILHRAKGADAHLRVVVRTHQPPSMRTHHNAWRVVNETPLCVLTRAERTHPSRRGRALGMAPKALTNSINLFIYILGEGLAADQDLEDEELEEKDPEENLEEGPEEKDPEENLEEGPEEKDPEMGPDQDMENEEMEEEVEQVPNDDEEFVDYFKLAPPSSPDSSDESLPPTDD
ncbi:hypothetical protein PIB30_079128 [Stylosanthes scabra]|uniref:Uncharacterized protein n=1 Tax=Stylosanthes scabra TaxID=79078 RepID=A0ABU6WRV1_9FABA|nr:hypothetical protein [Stylosanthes scabra]